MENFNYDEPADVFVGGGYVKNRRQLGYRRFPTGAEAVRFVMELQGAEKLADTVLESDDARFPADAIRVLYESADYPLTRRLVS